MIWEAEIENKHIYFLLKPATFWLLHYPGHKAPSWRATRDKHANNTQASHTQPIGKNKF